MYGFDLPTRDGWCVEGHLKGEKHPICKYYLVSAVKTKETAKEKFLKDTGHFEFEFDRIDVLECSM